jgi:uncharacterized protein (DUF2236 family)
MQAMTGLRIVTRDAHEAALAELAADVRAHGDPRAGILGPRSIAWQLGGDLAIFVGGGRAALLQLAHPMVAFAVDQHSKTRADVVGRFQRTFRNVFAMLFGDLDDALAAARRVHNVHTRIHGEIPIQIGRWRAGSAYHANDAHALRWVHGTLVDTTIAVRERLDGALPTALKDTYIVEMNRFAALFGIPRDLLPASYAEHSRYMTEMLVSDALGVTAVAREMGAFLVGRAASQSQPPLGRIAEALSVALLPSHIVRAFALSTTPVSRAATRAALAALAPTYRRIPRSVVAIPARSEAVRRIAGKPPSRLAAWTERRLFGLSRQVTGS